MRIHQTAYSYLTVVMAVRKWYTTDMRKANIDKEEIQRMTVYFPTGLLNRVYDSASLSKRSFNNQVLWLVENSLVASNGTNKVVAER